VQTIAAMVEAWLTQRRVGAVARVIGADGLGPRPSGDLLIVDINGRTGGSLLAGVAHPEYSPRRGACSPRMRRMLCCRSISSHSTQLPRG
jgi:xanthine/CO dehydrogenase XdhC/CoxF family maturation factor